LSLGQALAALYQAGSEERLWVDGGGGQEEEPGDMKEMKSTASNDFRKRL
jgi:hypothetical protein